MQYEFTDTESNPTEPITLARAREHCKVLHTKEDDLITDFIKAARHWLEGHLNRALVEKIVTVFFTAKELKNNNKGSYEIRLPVPTTVEDITSIKINGETFNVANTTLYTTRVPLLQIDADAYNELEDPNIIQVTYTATAYESKSNIKICLLKIVDNFHKKRDSTPLEDQVAITSLVTNDIIHMYT